MTDNFSLTIDNKRVWTFYNEHSNLNIESINITFIEIIEKLQGDMNSSLNTNIATQLLNNMKFLQTQITTVQDSVSKIQSDTNMFFSLKFSEMKLDYIENLKLLLNNNSNIEKIDKILKENNSALQDRVYFLLNTEILKNNGDLKTQIELQMKVLQSSINDDTNKLLHSSVDKKTLDDFVNTIETKFTTTLSNSQSLINTIINSSEQRLNSTINDVKSLTEKRLTDIKEISTANSNVSLGLNDNVSELLKKMNGSQAKGKISENLLMDILNSLYENDIIEYVGSTKESGDIILKRDDKPVILFENKNYSSSCNIKCDQIDKFIRDCTINKCCGIMISQHFGIAGKKNYHIDINDGFVLLYISHFNNDADKIRVAVDIIDNFYKNYSELNVDNEVINIDKNILDMINLEYKTFAETKLNQIKMVNDFHKKMVDELNNIKMPSLDKFLAERYAYSKSYISCDICGFNCKNVKALSSHKRSKTCKEIAANKKIENQNSIIID